MINISFVFSVFFIAVFLGMVLIPNILLISYKKKLFDMPGDRKVHSVPIPRLGGISFFPVILISFCLMMGVRCYLGFPVEALPVHQTLYEFLFLTVGCMLLYLVGVADDLIGVGYRYKFVIQIMTALLLVLSGNWLDSLDGLLGIYSIPWWAGMPLTVIVIVYITNAINLIDGIDGLASGLSCISLVSLALMLMDREEYIYAMLALATLGVLIPFWFYNVFGNAQRGHKLFMGDAGSLTLGYILSFLVIHLSKSSHPAAFGSGFGLLVVFSTLLVPLLDVVRVVLHRLREKKNPFLPDKNHFHHKLLRTGMRVRLVLVTILLVSVFFILINVFLSEVVNITLLFVLDVVLWTCLQLVINHYIKVHRKKEEELTRINKK